MSRRHALEEKSDAPTNPHEPDIKPPANKTARYNELPLWMQDNEYILAGYRWCVLHNALRASLACWIGRNTRSGIVPCLLSRVSDGPQQLKIRIDLLRFQTYTLRLVHHF